jgi:hypothetical protein
MGGDQSQPLCGSLVAILKWLKLIPNRASGGSGGGVGRGLAGLGGVRIVGGLRQRDVGRMSVPKNLPQGLKPDFVFHRYWHD